MQNLFYFLSFVFYIDKFKYIILFTYLKNNNLIFFKPCYLINHYKLKWQYYTSHVNLSSYTHFLHVTSLLIYLYKMYYLINTFLLLEKFFPSFFLVMKKTSTKNSTNEPIYILGGQVSPYSAHFTSVMSNFFGTLIFRSLGRVPTIVLSHSSQFESK